VNSVEAGIVALLAATAAGPLVLRAVTGRVVDIPNQRSSHSVPTPRGGGVAIIIGVLVGLLFAQASSGAVLAALVTAILLGFVGGLEDIRGIRISIRLVLQTAVGLVGVVWILNNLDRPALPWALTVILALVWLVGFTNAFNFMDGINGISAFQLIVAGLAWMVIGALGEMDWLVALGAITVGASLGFLPWNFPKARFFMGDVGSYFSGGWLAAVTIVGVGMGIHPAAMAAPLLVYVADTTYTLIRRVLRGEDWLKSHRSHVYQRLVILGWSHLKTAFFFALVAATVAATGLTWILDPGGFAVIGTVVAVIAIAGYLISPQLLLGSQTPEKNGDSGDLHRP
jgi:UDP-N-acetylmuramyl pentapeptide phosphotransferase/UDP-N-acetylglucosamine-1-phosphate transferase